MLYVCMVPLHAAISGVCETNGEHISLVVIQAKTSLAARISFAKVQVPVMVGCSTIALLPGLTGVMTTYGTPVIFILVAAGKGVLAVRQLRAQHKAIAQVSARLDVERGVMARTTATKPT